MHTDDADESNTVRFNVSRPTLPRHPALWHQFYRCTNAINACLTDLIRRSGVGEATRVVDYGCSVMPYRDLFPAQCRYIGADIAGNPLSNITLHGDGRLPLDDECADVVFSTQVLEHVQDPELYLRESHRVLVPGGRLILTTHGIFVYHPDPQDNWRWTSEGLRRLVEKQGYQVVEMRGLVGGPAAALQMFQDMTWYKLPRGTRKLYFVAMQLLVTLLDRACSEKGRKRDAWVFAVLAVKPDSPDAAVR